MSVKQFLSTSGFLFALMGLVSLLELVVPLFASDKRRERRAVTNLGLTLMTFFLNWGLVSIASVVALWLSLKGQGPLSSVALPQWVIVVVAVVILDLCTYLAHLAMHKVPFLWRVHCVHHADPFLDVTTSFRQHPIETMWRFLWIILPIWLLGIPAVALVIYRLLSAGNAVFEHANIGLWQPIDRLLSMAWVSPNMHKVHHSRAQAQTDSNYGNLLAIFDRGFRTFTPSHQALHVTYGLAEYGPKQSKSFSALLVLPFLTRHTPLDSGGDGRAAYPAEPQA